MTVVRSAATSPFSSDGTSLTRQGIGVASGRKWINGSVTRQEASWSLKLPANCMFSVVGACHCRIFSSPPAPRVWPSVPLVGSGDGRRLGCRLLGGDVGQAQDAQRDRRRDTKRDCSLQKVAA